MSLSSWGLEATRPGRLRLTSVVALYGVRLRRRWIQELLAVLGIAAGVALLYATHVASTSLSAPVRNITSGIVGNSQLQLLSRASTGLPEAVYDDVISLPGVVRAAPLLNVPANVVGPRGQHDVTVFGADPRIVELRGTLLQGFESSDAAEQESIVIPAPMARAIGLRFGDDVRLQIAGRTIRVPAVVAGREQIGPLANNAVALAPLDYLQRLTGAGQRVTRILVEAEPDKVADVRRAVDGIAGGQFDVRPAKYEATLFDEAAKPTTQASTIFSALSALVGFLFAVCALVVTAAERRRLAAQQHEQGYPPSATLLTLLVDAFAIGIAGTVLGLAAGEALSRHGFDADVSFLSGAFPIGDQRVVTWESVAFASLAGLAAAILGVLAPVRDVVAATLPGGARRLEAASRDEPSSGSRGGRAARVVVGLGLACLLAAITITVLAPGAAVAGVALLAVALLLLLPTILTAAIVALEWCNRRGRSLASVQLALQQLRARRWRARALAITATGAVAVFGASALQGARANLQTGLDDVVTGLADNASVWAAQPGAGSAIGTSSFPPVAATTLARLPEVESVSLYRAGLLDVADRRIWVIGSPRTGHQPFPPHQILDGDERQAPGRVRAGGWATVSQALADKLRVGVGDRFTLPAPAPIDLRVAAITTNLGWSSGTVVINADEFARGWRSTAVAAYHLEPRQGASPTAVAAAASRALGSGSGLRVETAAERAARQSEIGRAGLSRLRQIAILTAVAAVLAMAAAMTGLLWQHRPVVTSLKLHGLRTGLLWRALTVETAVLFGTGALAGGLFALLGQVLCTRGLQVVTGFPVAEGLRPGVVAATVGLVIGTSVLVVIVPGYVVARARPGWQD